MKRVLIIDDEVDLCMLIKSYLSKKNCEVYIAHSLTEGFKKLEDLSPDALLLDNNLPDGMGWKEADKIHIRFPYMNITLISAFQIPKEFKSQISNSVHFLEKPITLHDIEKYI